MILQMTNSEDISNQSSRSNIKELLKIIDKKILPSEISIPDTCNSCSKLGRDEMGKPIIKEGQLLCISKKGVTDSIKHQWIDPLVGKGCRMPFNTSINKQTREQLQAKIEEWERIALNAGTRIEELEKDVERLPIIKKELRDTRDKIASLEPLVNENRLLKSRCSDLEIICQKKEEELAPLQNDNEHLKNKVNELSHDAILEENQYLKVQLANEEDALKNREMEIRKLEALIRVTREAFSDAIFRTGKMLKEFADYNQSINIAKCEQCVEGYSFKAFSRGIATKIEDLQGYLNTIQK